MKKRKKGMSWLIAQGKRLESVLNISKPQSRLAFDGRNNHAVSGDFALHPEDA